MADHYTIDIVADGLSAGRFTLNLAQDHYYAKIFLSRAELKQLKSVDNASWDDRTTLQLGTCVATPVHWCCDDKYLSAPIGADPEVWGVSLTVPVAFVPKLVDAIESALETGSATA